MFRGMVLPDPLLVAAEYDTVIIAAKKGMSMDLVGDKGDRSFMFMFAEKR